MAKAKAPNRTSKRAASKRRKPAAARRAAVRGGDRDSRVIETVLAAFAHDIRTPLTGILALSELLATSDLGERERRWIAAVKDAAEHVADLTTLIVEGARAGSGRMAPRHETFHLPRFAAALAASFAARAEAKNLVCETDIAADLPEYVSGDAVQLRTALENLLANAVKFTEHGKVGLKAEAAPRARGKLRLGFTVTDSGIGVSAAEVKRLFRPFAQANREIVQKFGGSGLGLVQVRRLAKVMCGDLKVKSVPGDGSTFRLTVTVDRAAPHEARTGALAARESGGAAVRTLSILCVEDNPYGRVVMNAILAELGHRVDFAGSGEGAIEAVVRGEHDVVLMDITLAGMDGFEATRRIRALPGTAARMPVIGISGRTRATDADAAVAAGMNAYLTKPVSPRVLSDMLAKLQEGRADAGE
jgi:CheY-like chemotaxis protein/nitrogen-specific signal transduction histidine kinase